MQDKELIQQQLNELIQKDLVDILSNYSKNKILDLELIIRLVQDITLFKAYDVVYIHNSEFDEIFNLIKDELKNLNTARVVALLSCLDFLQNVNQDFKELIYINLSFKVPSKIFLESFSFFNVLVSNVKDLFNEFMIYLFNNKFLAFNENIQIDLIYKIWGLSRQVYHDNEASKFIYKDLKLLFDKALLFEKTEVAFWLYYTPLHYFHSGTGNNIDELNEKFKIEIEKPLEKYILEKIVPKYEIKPNLKELNKNKKIKVAFIMQRIILHSTINVFYTLIKAISKQNDIFEFIIYDLSLPEVGGSNKTFVEEFKALNVKFVNLHEKIFGNLNPTYSLFEKCIKTRNILIEDNIDIMIGLHTRIEYLFLYATRSIPKQIYWYHSSNAQYDIKGIDFRIKHGDFSVKEVIHDKFSFLQFGDLMDKKYLNPQIPYNLISGETRKYPINSIKLGTIGRLSKIDSSEYIHLIDEILKENPNTIYIAAGFGDVESIKNKISKETISRWYFPGQIHGHLYGHIIDIWPNTFPDPQGLSTLEFMAKSKPVITMKNNSHDFKVQEKYNKERTDKFKDYPMNVKNIEEYKRSLNLIITNPEARNLIGKLNFEYIKNNYYDTSKSVSRFYEILKKVIS